MKWYDEAVLDATQKAIVQDLYAVGLTVEGLAKVNVEHNGQVDTGFMLNSIYTGGVGKSTYAAHTGQYQQQPAPQIVPDEDVVVVCAAAEYSIYQEARNSFLYRALQQVAGPKAQAKMGGNPI